MFEKKEVRYKVFSTLHFVKKALRYLDTLDTVSFDMETRSIYTKDIRAEVKELQNTDYGIPYESEYKMIANSSGLSHPSIVRVTHIIFGISTEESYIFIVDANLEAMVFKWLVSTKVKLLIHNASFDLKIVHHRTGKFPIDYEDTQLLAKTLINNCSTYKSRTGLKVLMGSQYSPKWSTETDYEVEDLRDKDFLEYCAIDGVSVLQLWYDMKEIIEEG